MKLLNSDYLNAQSLILPSYEQIALYLIGCGGTGSWLAPTLCRLARLLNEKNKPTQVTFIDPDIVEEKNLIRQNFCAAETGLNKAQTLALRYSAAWGVEIGAVVQPFQSQRILSEVNTLTLLIGCVDNAEARNSIAQTLNNHQFYARTATSLWWLDCGNHATSGQVLLGSHLDLEPQTYQFNELGCPRLPAPTLQHRELLIPQGEELIHSGLSCEELAFRNTQSLGINQMVAAYASEYLIEFITGKLKRFATYFDLISGAAQSVYITQENVTKVVKSM